MKHTAFPVIDLPATGENILRLRQARGLSVRDLQEFFGFEEPQAIYKWQKGQSLPTVDNLYALGALLEVPIEDILVPRTRNSNMTAFEQQAAACCSNHFLKTFYPLKRKLSFNLWLNSRQRAKNRNKAQLAVSARCKQP